MSVYDDLNVADLTVSDLFQLLDGEGYMNVRDAVNAFVSTSGQGSTTGTPARAYADTTAFTAAGFNVVPVNHVFFDAEGAFNTSLYLYKCKRAGYYRVAGHVQVATQAAGFDFCAAISVNGSMAALGNRGQTGPSASQVVAGSEVNDVVKCAATDYIQLQAYTSVVTAYSVANGSLTNHLTVQQVA